MCLFIQEGAKPQVGVIMVLRIIVPRAFYIITIILYN
jgi:hypothetical protein